MGRKCNGYRDPVAALFRDESKGFATKRQRVNGPKKSPSTASRKSSQEIDKALAACSTIFGASSLSDSDQSRENSLPVEPIPEWLETRPSIEDQGTCFLDAKYIMDEPDTFDDNLRFMSNIYACEQAKDALVENDTSLGIGGLANYCGASDTLIDSHPRYNLAFIGHYYIAGQDHDRFVAGDYSPGISDTCADTSSAIDPRLLNFDRVTKQPTSIDFELDPNIEHRNSLPLANITWSMESQAPCYFFANYVLENTSCSKGYLEYLPGLCENEVTNGFLTEAVTALGLVGLAMRRHDSSALNSARKNYASALNQLNVALTSKEGALTDHALITVFLLGLYEVICTHFFHLDMPTNLVADQHLFDSSKYPSMDKAYQWSNSNVAASR